MSNKYVIIYSNNVDSNSNKHVRSRKFSTYIENNLSQWKLIKHIPNKYPYNIEIGNKDIKNYSISDFYIYELNKNKKN